MLKKIAGETGHDVTNSDISDIISLNSEKMIENTKTEISIKFTEKVVIYAERVCSLSLSMDVFTERVITFSECLVWITDCSVAPAELAENRTDSKFIKAELS